MIIIQSLVKIDTHKKLIEQNKNKNYYVGLHKKIAPSNIRKKLMQPYSKTK